jgi:hypothetical protein
MFWFTILASLLSGLAGYFVSRWCDLTIGNATLELRPTGAVVLAAVAWFFLTMPFAALRKRIARAHAHTPGDDPRGCCLPPAATE